MDVISRYSTRVGVGAYVMWRCCWSSSSSSSSSSSFLPGVRCARHDDDEAKKHLTQNKKHCYLGFSFFKFSKS